MSHFYRKQGKAMFLHLSVCLQSGVSLQTETPLLPDLDRDTPQEEHRTRQEMTSYTPWKEHGTRHEATLYTPWN